MPLTSGFNHVATLTEDLDRLIAFYVEVFDADIEELTGDGIRHAMIHLGAGAALHPFQLDGNPHAPASPAMFDRGHVDHVALNVDDDEAFETLRRRLVERGASDGTVTDFGMCRSVFFRDPDGFEAEVAQWTEGAPLTYAERRQFAYPR